MYIVQMIPFFFLSQNDSHSKKKNNNNNNKKPLTVNKSEGGEKHENNGLFYNLQRFQTYLHP